MSHFIRGATEADAASVALRLRHCDREEVEAVTGLSPQAALLGMVSRASQAFSLCTLDGEPQGLLGVSDVYMTPGVGYVWLLFTDKLYEHRTEFLRRCRGFLPILHAHHPMLLNYVDERNETHIRWIRWMGFTIIRRVPYGAGQLPFLEFVRHQSCA